MRDPLAAEKRRLRQEIAQLRRVVSPAEALRAGERVAEALARCPAVADAARLGLYAALPDELPTRPCFERLAAPGRQLALPVCGVGAGLRYRAFESWEALRPGRRGVFEPPPEAHEIVLGPGDVVLVPGVAFDSDGGRLGRGGGHYDATFPPGRAGPLLVGLAWEFQLVDAVPCGSRDRRVDAIVTESGCRQVAGRRG